MYIIYYIFRTCEIPKTFLFRTSKILKKDPKINYGEVNASYLSSFREF